MKVFSAIVIVLTLTTACQSVDRCAVPDPVKMRKSSGNGGIKAYQLHLREKAGERKEMMAQRKQLLKVYNVEGKKIDEMEYWDCPRPGSRHARQVKRQWQKKEKMHAQALKKDKEKSDVVLKDLKTWSDSQ
jgi:hypothetical protein